MPLPFPERPERRRQAQEVFALARGLEPIQDSSKVGLLGFEPVEPLRVRPDQVRFCLLGQREEVVGVATAPP
jgi:hypothetical protein